MCTEDEVRLIATHILDVPSVDAHRRNEAVLKRTGTPVWAVVGYCLRACDGAIDLAAHDYHLTPEEVRAALAYYRQHPELDVSREEEHEHGEDAVSGRMHLGAASGTASAA